MTRRALIVWGGWEGHQPRECAEHVAAQLETGGWEVTLANGCEVFAGLARDGTPAVSQVEIPDVIVPCWTMGELTDGEEQGLCEAVRRGAGLVGWHGGMADAFRSRTEYSFMVGGQFVAHPGGVVDYEVRIADTNHPITRGLEGFRVRTEQYYLHVDPSNHVLATTTFGADPCPWIDGCEMPVAWTRRYGEGRVFYCALGHGIEELKHPPTAQLLRRGILWAARSKEVS